MTAPSATCGKKWGSSQRTQGCVLPPHDTGMHRDAKGREWPLRRDTPWWPMAKRGGEPRA